MKHARIIDGHKITPAYGRILVAIAQWGHPVPINSYHRISERALQRMGLLRSTRVEESAVPHWRVTAAGQGIVDSLLASDDPPMPASRSAAPYTVGR